MNKIFRTALLACSALTICVVLQISAFAQAKGKDVTEVTIAAAGLAPEIIYRQSGAKSWQVISRGNVTQTCSETNRDDWSVYLACSQNTAVVLDLFKKERSVSVNGTTLKSPIASSSNAPFAAPTPDTTDTSATRSGETPTLPSPLTVNEMSRVMQWISVRTSAARLPFCWRQSYGRGFGKIMECRPGYVKEGLFCFTPCKANETGADEQCYQNCPEGFRNDGLYCGKPGAKTRESFGWRPGDPLLPNYSGPTGRCEAKYGKGNCEQGGALIFPKCGTGFTPVAGGSVCTPICPSGFEDIGVSCKKPASKRGVAYASVCPAGTVKDPTGEICYPACEPGRVSGTQEAAFINAGPPNKYKGVGPVCWQNCPSQHPEDCGAGCATTGTECAKSVITMTTSPIIAAVKIAALIVTFGGSAGATGSAGAAVGGGKLVANFPKLAGLADKAEKLQRFYKANEVAIKAAMANKTMFLAWKSQIEIFATEFAEPENFGLMTSPEVAQAIKEKFTPQAALEIRKEWGRRHVGLMMEANAIGTVQNVLSVAGIADPTGLVGVVSAFTNPLCKDDTPFPNVNPKY